MTGSKEFTVQQLFIKELRLNSNHELEGDGRLESFEGGGASDRSPGFIFTPSILKFGPFARAQDNRSSSPAVVA